MYLYYEQTFYEVHQDSIIEIVYLSELLYKIYINNHLKDLTMALIFQTCPDAIGGCFR